MADFFWFSDAQWARIEPYLPMDVRGKKQRRVLSGIVHALKCGGRWADCADVFGPTRHSTIDLCVGPSAGSGRISFVRWPVPRVQRTGYSSTAVASRSTAAPGVEKSAELVADKGYDSQARGEWLDARGTEAIIPSRKNRKTQYDYYKAIYKQRNIIERMFCRLALRSQHQNLHGLNRSSRNCHLVATMSPDPNERCI
jgi:transposase